MICENPETNPTDITVIEDPTMVLMDTAEARQPGYTFVDAYTVRAHPTIVDVLLLREEAERLWTIEEIMASVHPSAGGAE